MSDFGLMHKTAKCRVRSKLSLIEALRSLSEGDCDFNGENGLEYLHPEVWEANGYVDYDEYMQCGKLKLKYESNKEYYLSLVLKENNEEEAIQNYLSNWLDKDRYYSEWDADIAVEENTIFISIAALTYC